MSIATSDARGTIAVSTCEKQNDAQPKLLYSFAKSRDADVGECGWTGVALHPTQASHVCEGCLFFVSFVLFFLCVLFCFCFCVCFPLI